ncbi:hypothetical protein GCM10010298_15920 [Streptomyces microflavus]|nr:hypothetical protein GCM10010298_15920 [Streptomyces microflavus]
MLRSGVLCALRSRGALCAPLWSYLQIVIHPQSYPQDGFSTWGQVDTLMRHHRQINAVTLDAPTGGRLGTTPPESREFP